MASARTLARVEAWVWVLIYGGLITLVLGLFTARADTGLGFTLGFLGMAGVFAGAVLLWLRSRMRLDADPPIPSNK